MPRNSGSNRRRLTATEMVGRMTWDHDPPGAEHGQRKPRSRSDVDRAGDGFRCNRRPSLRVTVLMLAQPRPLQGRKILIVEDEAPIALSLASAVAQAGGVAVGPAAPVAASFAPMADHTLDVALPVIRLRGEASFPLAG